MSKFILRFTARSARTHSFLLAVVLWVLIAMYAFTGDGYRNQYNRLKGSDFIQFYTYGSFGLETSGGDFYDPDIFYGRQVALVPESVPEHYLPVYPPHVALMFAPFAYLPYGSAALVNATLIVALYAAVVVVAWWPFKSLLSNKGLLLTAAAAFPPLYSLVIHGQVTTVPLIAFCAAWLFLERSRRFWAGFALGLLLLKPQFALVLAVVTLVCGEWAMVAGAIASIGLQVALVVATMGPSAIVRYASVVASLAEWQSLLEPKPEQMHSLAALTNLLPTPWATAAWLVLVSLTVTLVLAVWKSTAPASVKMSIVVTGSALVNPHLFSYDATVLFLPIVWLAGWIYSDIDRSRSLGTVAWLAAYALYITLLVPTASFVVVQGSVLVVAAIFFVVVKRVVLESRAAGGTILARGVP